MAAFELPTQHSVAGAQLAARLRWLESRFDGIQAEVVASGTAATDFAAEATRRIAALEKDIERLQMSAAAVHTHRWPPETLEDSLEVPMRIRGDGDAPSVGACERMTVGGLHELLAQATANLLDDVRGCTRRLLGNVGQEVSRALEAGMTAATAAAERAAAKHAEQVAADFVVRVAALESKCAADGGAETFGKEHRGAACCDAGAAAHLAAKEAREKAAEATAAEARIEERVSQCVSLVDAACNPASCPLEAFRDLVVSLESVSERVGALEGSSILHAPPTPALEQQRGTPTASDHQRINEQLKALWATVREISREICDLRSASTRPHHSDYGDDARFAKQVSPLPQ